VCVVLYDDCVGCRRCIRRSVDDCSAVHVSPIGRECVVSLVVISGVSAANGETAADDRAEYDEEDDPTRDVCARTVAVAVVTAVVTRARAHRDERSNHQHNQQRQSLRRRRHGRESEERRDEIRGLS